MTNIDDILKVADKVIAFPATTLEESCKEFGVKYSLTTAGFVGGIIGATPVLYGGLWIANKLFRKQREAQEKERMKNALIAKQQAIIKKLEKELKLKQEEIKNLKDTLAMLERAVAELNI